MPTRSEKVGAHLGALWLCAASVLPNVADIFAKGREGVSGSEDSASVFAREGTIPGAPGISGSVSGPVFPAWNNLCNELEKMMTDSVDNLNETRFALLRVVEMFADEDRAAAAAFRREKDNYRADGFNIRSDVLLTPSNFPNGLRKS